MFFGYKKKIKKRTITCVGDNKSIVPVKKNRASQGTSVFNKALIVLILLIFLGVTVYVLFFSSFLTVTTVNVTGTQDLDPALIQEVAASSLSGRYLDLIEKNNIILADPEKMENMIQDKFKRIETVQVEKKFPETMDVSVIERKSMLILCSQNKCFIVDNGGAAYAQADFESNELKENELLVLHDDGNREVRLSEKILAPEYIQYLSEIKDGLKNYLEIKIDKNYHTPQLVSGDVRVVTEEGWGIYFATDVPIKKELEMLKIVLGEKIEKGKRGELEYVDLRIDNKVFYKFKNTEPDPEQAVDEIKKEEVEKKK